MRSPWISEDEVLRERLADPAQVTAAEPEDRLPDYATAFLAHLRLLVGIPFEYLVPDTAMLPDESIRFFHLDRSWTDRVVDGVLAVGKVGSREQAHHHAAAPALDARLDALEPAVRPVQRGLARFAPSDTDPSTGSEISGFLLRSALVAGWPHMEIRAWRESMQLTLLRLERLSSSVLVALFAGVPDRMELEEPHHGVQFGVTGDPDGPGRGASFSIDPRLPNGRRHNPAVPMPVGVRPIDPDLRVAELADLRRIISYRTDLDTPALPIQHGAAAFTLQLLRPPWKQVFSDEDDSGSGPSALRTSLATAPQTRVGSAAKRSADTEEPSAPGDPVEEMAERLAAAVDLDHLLATAGVTGTRSAS
jgi:hypothetical protein